MFYSHSSKKNHNGIIAAGVVDGIYLNQTDENVIKQYLRKRSGLPSSKFRLLSDFKQPVSLIDFLYNFRVNSNELLDDRLNEIGVDVKSLHAMNVLKLTRIQSDNIYNELLKNEQDYITD